MYLVHLRINDGNTFEVRCRELARCSVVPGNILLLGVQDPLPTPHGEFKTNVWSLAPVDIANYQEGDYLPASDPDDSAGQAAVPVQPPQAAQPPQVTPPQTPQEAPATTQRRKAAAPRPE